MMSLINGRMGTIALTVRDVISERKTQTTRGVSSHDLHPVELRWTVQEDRERERERWEEGDWE